jgi:hypothetical protein
LWVLLKWCRRIVLQKVWNFCYFLEKDDDMNFYGIACWLCRHRMNCPHADVEESGFLISKDGSDLYRSQLSEFLFWCSSRNEISGG